MTDDVLPQSDQPEPEQDSNRQEAAEPPSDAAAVEEISRAAAADTFEQAIDGSAEEVPPEEEEAEPIAEPVPPPKLERLQKILAQAGIASRRHAEELITQGRVQINGKVVTELGTKADAARDHIRVDGKLLQGSERLRYYMLNKPKGFVTTVSDPEGRPTIMQFFSKMRERLYPVGRLDYLSEGLLLVTNDGELANKLTRAASNVEKTYLVKVSGQPTEEDIERLRQGVGIERGKPGSGRVKTAPADIRRVRQGDNPWYEVVLIEGRNRELRKMFEEVGHHVEKIRRVGYGPLVLDLEPGKIRELDPEELENLNKAAVGKYRKPKPHGTSRASASEAQLPTVRPRWNDRRSPNTRSDATADRAPSRRPEFGSGRGSSRPPNRGPAHRPSRGPERRSERGSDRGSSRNQFRSRPEGEFQSRPRFEAERTQRPPRTDTRGAKRPFGGEARQNRFGSMEGQSRDRGNRPAWNDKPERGSRPPRFDSETRRGRASGHPGQFHRPDRGDGPQRGRGPVRPPAGTFRPKPAEGRGPQHFEAKRNAPPTGFPVRRRLEIHPADEDFGRQEKGTPARQNRSFDRRPDRPFQARSGARPGTGRGSSGPRFEGKNRPPFNPDREDRPRFDRPRRAADPGGQSEERPKRADRPKPGSRPGGFSRSGAGGRGKSFGSKPGSARSGSGRHPGSRPGGKPGRKSGGKPGGRKRP